VTWSDLDAAFDQQLLCVATSSGRIGAAHRVEYALTDLGHTMCAPVAAVRAWAEKYADAIEAARATHDAST
jgi:hypothetical protein